MSEEELKVTERLKKLLLSLSLFSSLVVGVGLRGYQLDPANSVIESVRSGAGLEFLWVFPRQSGKDEAIAQLCSYLLTLYRHSEKSSIVHTYPTKSQISTGTSRLELRLKNHLTARWWKRTKPERRGLGQASVTFFSGHPQAKAEGATASLLLIVNETQDQLETVVERRFTPMRASTNATVVYVGTVRTTSDYLWRVKQRLEKLEQQDGIKRVFIVSPDEVGQENPLYRAFVEAQIAAKGRHHPSVRTELFNEPLETASGLFPERRRAMMLGTHARLRSPATGEIYLALIDVGGGDEKATDQFTEGESLANPDRDYSAVTIVRVKRDADLVGPLYEVVDILVEQGTRHFQEGLARPSLFSKTLAYLKHWNVNAVISDMTGLGQGFTDALIQAYKRPVFGFTFNSITKARLGNDFLATVETGRFKYFKDGFSEPGSDAWWFFVQCEYCGYELAAGLPIERGLRWSVSPAAKITISDSPLPIHDDRLLSAALVAEADRLYKSGELFLSTGESAVIKRDLMGEIDSRRKDERWS